MLCLRNLEGWSDRCDTTRRIWQIVALVYWLPFTFLSVYVTLGSSILLAYVTLCIMGLIAVGPVLGGMDVVQARLSLLNAGK